MIKNLLLLIVVVFTLQFVSAEDTFNPGGMMYFTLFTDFQNTDSAYYFEDGNKDPNLNAELLLNPVLKLGSVNIAFGLFDFNMILGRNDFNSEFDEKIDFQINEFYGIINFFNWVKLKIGKQRVVWGVSFAHNPSDFINPPKDPTGLDNTKEGVISLNIDLFTTVLTLTGIGVVDDNFETSGIGTKLTTDIIPLTDLNLVYYYSEATDHCMGFSFQSIPFMMSDFLSSLLIYGEAGFAFKSMYPEIEIIDDAGPAYLQAQPSTSDDLNYSFSTGILVEIPVIKANLGCEYYYISDAYSKDEFETIIEALQTKDDPGFPNNIIWYDYISPAKNSTQYLVLSLGKDYLTEYGNTFTNTFGFNIIFLWCLIDNSSLLTIELKSGIIANSEVIVKVSTAIGDSTSDFGNMPYQTRLELGMKIGF